uniref:Deoxyribonuclease TATDN1 n=1 Tax=Crassostrea virginica TaxID=6565 RepID=A0A8B8CHI5_CRAVI|nr:putative deoxyribonuclease TATDN1 [Crassostrea virginica]
MAVLGNMRSLLKFIDIGVNLSDPMFRGVYHNSTKHPDDFNDVISRAKDNGMVKMILTGGYLSECRETLELCKTDVLFGYRYILLHGRLSSDSLSRVHKGGPRNISTDLLELALANKGKVVAIGECGLDYDRLHFCPKDVQLKYFEKQMDLVEATKLPMFLHSRNCHSDFIDIIKRNRDRIAGGVVHSFTGTVAEAKEILEQDLYIGINGCSLKTQENIDAMCSIPTERLMIETDAPWCEIRPTHAGYKHIKTQFPTKKKEKWEKNFCVKSRNEPAFIIQVLEVMSATRQTDIGELADQLYNNTCQLFFPK